MDGRNDEAKNQYGLRNRAHNNRDDGLRIDKQGSDNKEEEEEEVDRPHQRRRVDKANNKDPEENLNVPVEIDFEGNLEQILNPGGRVGGHVEKNGQKGSLHDNQGHGGVGCGRADNN